MFLGALTFSFSGVAAPPAAMVPESHATAGYLVLFARYVEWPASGDGTEPTRPFVVGVLGHDPFGGVLELTFLNAEVNGRSVMVRRVGSAIEARSCDLVFISRDESRRQALWLSELQGAPVLTVGEGESALEDGAGVVLIREKAGKGSRLRFDLNMEALNRAGLKVGSPMMVSARRIARIPSEKE